MFFYFLFIQYAKIVLHIIINIIIIIVLKVYETNNLLFLFIYLIIFLPIIQHAMFYCHSVSFSHLLNHYDNMKLRKIKYK